MPGSLKCPFSTALVSEKYVCRHADQVVRRGGSEIDCRAEQSYAQCRKVYEELKKVALPAFGVEDDLLSMPHSVLQKVQFGGLQALQQLLAVADGCDVIDVINHASDWSSHAYQACVETMVNFKLRRR